jgi:hypothetical protein
MPSQIGKLKYLFVFLLFICCAGIFGYELMYSIPKKKCDASGGWYSFRYRTCAAPIYLPSLTHRKPGDPATLNFHEDAKKASNQEALDPKTRNGAASS